jgi:transposase
MVDRALARMHEDFERMYSHTGRPSIAPERLLRAQLLMVLYSIRSEPQLMEQLDYNLLFRWFVGLEMDDPIWDVSVFTKNRERLIAGEVSQRLLEAVLVEARAHGLLSEEHFTVDGTLIEAWAAARSFQEKNDPPGPGQGSGSGGEVLLRQGGIDDRSGRAAVQEGDGRQGSAGLSRACADREPQWAGSGGRSHAGGHGSIAGSGAAHAGPRGPAGPAPAGTGTHAGRRHPVSGWSVRGRVTRPGGSAARQRIHPSGPQPEQEQP